MVAVEILYRMLGYLTMDEKTWAYIVLFLASVPWVVYSMAVTFFIMSIIYGKSRLYREDDPTVMYDELPGVSVIKPLMGVDEYLEKNLESHFTLKYPRYELLLCVQDDQDPALNLVDKLRARHPTVDCRVFIGGKDGILNPMVHNMSPGYENAKYDIIWVSTSRILATTPILMDMVAKLNNPKVALVHQMPFTTDQPQLGLAAAVEKVYFGATVGRFYMAFHVLGISCFTGMSYLVKKTELDEVNGLSWFGRFLAEDFFIAKVLHEKGFRHSIAAVPAQQNVASCSIAAYKDRMVRWLRLRLNMVPFTAAVLEPLGESIPIGVYMSWSMFYFFGFNPYLCFVIHWCFWCLLDYIQLTTVQRSPLPFSKLMFLRAWLIRETLYVLVYFEAVINVRRIKWGKHTYRLSNYGESLEIVSDKSSILQL